jgi:hypothetical protein
MRVGHIAVVITLAGARSSMGAQEPAPSSIHATSAQECRIGASRRALRVAGGATLGAWLGFVVAKIKLSDWNDGSHGASATRQRNQAVVGGALLGAVLGAVPFHTASCGAPTMPLTNPSRDRQATRPISAEEIARSGVNGSVYDVVYSLRRNWLNVRGVQSISEGPHVVSTDAGEKVVSGEPQLVIYLDNMRMGAISQLRSLSTVGVSEIRYYDPSQANLRWGAGHSHGAIEVLTVTGAP